MRFVPVKSAEQQAALMLVNLRDRLIAQSHAAGECPSRPRSRNLASSPPKGMAHVVPLLERIDAH